MHAWSGAASLPLCERFFVKRQRHDRPGLTRPRAISCRAGLRRAPASECRGGNASGDARSMKLKITVVGAGLVGLLHRPLAAGAGPRGRAGRQGRAPRQGVPVERRGSRHVLSLADGEPGPATAGTGPRARAFSRFPPQRRQPRVGASLRASRARRLAPPGLSGRVSLPSTGSSPCPGRSPRNADGKERLRRAAHRQRLASISTSAPPLSEAARPQLEAFERNGVGLEILGRDELLDLRTASRRRASSEPCCSPAAPGSASLPNWGRPISPFSMPGAGTSAACEITGIDPGAATLGLAGREST